MRHDTASIEAGAAYLDDVARRNRSRIQRESKQVLAVKDDEGFDCLTTLTEDSLATAFASAHDGKLLLDHTRAKWFLWDGNRWQLEETRLAFDWVRRFCRNLNTKGMEKWARVELPRFH